MSKRTQGSATTTADKKWLTSSASALAAALTVLTASLRVTQGAPVPDVNPGAKSPADPLRENIADNNNKGHLSSSVKFKFTTTTKDKVDTYMEKPASSGTKPTSPSGVSTSHGSGGHK
jgi:hypothetical protein